MGSPTGPSAGGKERKKEKKKEKNRERDAKKEERRETERERFVPFGLASTSVNAAGLPRTPRRTH